jgi:antitoxin (DNA-binding transcriptional repressor) of toxin-antitoxin stability system
MKPATVTIGKLRDGLSAHLQRVRRGQALVVLDRSVPVARIIPFEPELDADEELRDLIARGVVRPPIGPMDWAAFEAMPTVKVRGNAALEALLKNREEERY